MPALAMFVCFSLATMALPGAGKPSPYAILLACVAIFSAAYAIVRGLPTFAIPDRSQSSLRVATCNLWMANTSYRAASSVLTEIDADILMLQELAPDSGLMLEPVSFQYPFKTSCNYCSQAVWSRLPFTERGSTADNWPLPKEQQVLGIAWAKVKWGAEREFAAVSIHMGHIGLDGRQIEQYQELTRLIKGFNDDAILVGGDFNTSPDSLRFRRFLGESRLRRISFHASWPDILPIQDTSIKLPFPLIAIDQVLAGTQWAPIGTRSVGGLEADHYCSVVDVVLKD